MAELKINITDVIERAVEKLEAEGYTVQKWIPVSERMPFNNQQVIFTGYDPDLYYLDDDGSNNFMYVGWYKAEQGRGRSLGYKSLRKGFYATSPSGRQKWMAFDFVTHWMPLPDMPKEDET